MSQVYQVEIKGKTYQAEKLGSSAVVLCFDGTFFKILGTYSLEGQEWPPLDLISKYGMEEEKGVKAKEGSKPSCSE